MKAYLVTVMVIDHDRIGAKEIGSVIENARYPNHCISPRVMSVLEKGIGRWSDDHPLNQTATWREEAKRLFGSALG